MTGPTTPRDALKRPKLAISFSGGRTSAYMTHRILREYKDTHEIVVTFANTGLEHEKTLEFVHNCDTRMGFGTVWLEAVVDPELGKGIRHKVVDFETAARNGEPFEEVIKKYGIPFSQFPHCTTYLKVYVMQSYLRYLGWAKKDYKTAIGVRSDEIDRMSSNAERDGLFYPCVKWGVNEGQVKSFWAKQNFDLDLEQPYGNCTTCWKKSKRKLMTIAKYTPEAFNFMKRMEDEYSNGRGDITPHLKRSFFRKNETALDILAAAKKPFNEYRYNGFQMEMFDPELDTQSACGETCEIGADQ